MEKYVLIAEYKSEEPLVYETYLSNSSYEEVSERMESLSNNPKIIRVAMARLVFENGNKSLFKGEENDR